MCKKLLSFALLSLLTGCVSTPHFEIAQVDLTLTPKNVVEEAPANNGKTILWGGTILDTHNLKDMTQIEVLAYPLDSSHRPIQGSKPLGRFIVRNAGYLEATHYAQGRLLTTLGTVLKNQSGKIGESSYTYPVINAKQLHLWQPHDDQIDTRFHFGFGIRL